PCELADALLACCGSETASVPFCVAPPHAMRASARNFRSFIMFGEAYDSPNALAADDYEKKYMSGEGALASARARMPWMFDVLLLVLAGFTTATSLASGTWAALATVPLLLLVWILFMFLRVTVTRDALHVQLGLFGPKIAMDEITSASVAKYDAL